MLYIDKLPVLTVVEHGHGSAAPSRRKASIATRGLRSRGAKQSGPTTHSSPRPTAHVTRAGPKQGDFLFFIFVFKKNIFSFSKFTEIYPAAPQPGGRDLVAPLRGGRDFSAKKIRKKFTLKPLAASASTSTAAGGS